MAKTFWEGTEAANMDNIPVPQPKSKTVFSAKIDSLLRIASLYASVLTVS